MGKPTGFLDYTRLDTPARDPKQRVQDYAPLHSPLSETNRRRQSGRCMDCGVPFCQAGVRFDGQLLGCPLHNLIPEWNDLLWAGNYEEALHRLLKTNCFPEFTGRVCPALCERACTCGMIGQPVTVHDNELAIIEFAFENDLMQPNPPAVRSDKSIAVIGSGPAGLASAYYLNRRGHNVTVFERDPLPGGLLRYGITPMKLPPEIVDRRIALMEREGVVFRTGCDIGKDMPPQQLAEKFDLAIFCCGAQQPRPLPFAGQAQQGVSYALAYLHAAAEARMAGVESALSAAGKHVVLVGAGDSASDCIATALRQGCSSITQLIRRPASDYPPTLDYAHEESQAVYGADIRRFKTQIAQLSCDAQGALTGVITDSGEQLQAQLLILASGFAGCEPYATEAAEQLRALGLPVLQAGDMTLGSTLVVQAIADGKRAAAEADRALMGYTNIL